jgi:CBS domain-containing protein
MRATDVMTSEVITVHEDTSVQAAAQLMAERGISALPVVDRDNRVIGMVSEGDLLHRAETGTERRRSWWLEMMASTNRLAEDYIKSHGGKVKDVMTHDVLSVTEETPVADIAVLLETNRVKRVPVLRNGKLVGIVSRANLVRALAMTIDEAPGDFEADDQAIRARLLAELRHSDGRRSHPPISRSRMGLCICGLRIFPTRKSGRLWSPPRAPPGFGASKITCGGSPLL